MRNAIAAYDALPRWNPANREHLLAHPMALITEDHLKQQCLEWFQELGYIYAFAADLAPDGATPEGSDYRKVIFTGRLRSAIQRLNPGVPAGTIESALHQLANPNVPAPLASNRNFHRWMTQGLPITCMEGNQQVGITLKVIGFDYPASKDWLVVYFNGLPLAVIELKNPTGQNTDIWAAFNQLQTISKTSTTCSRPMCCWLSVLASRHA